MDAEPQADISAITEIPDRSIGSPVGNFLAATGWGSLAGTLAVVAAGIISTVANLPREGWALSDGFFALALVYLFAAVLTLAGNLLIGLPVTLILRLLRCDRIATYAACGAIAGFLAIVLLFEIPPTEQALFFTFGGAGAAAGFASALRWGRWRETLAEARRAQELAPEPDPDTQPTRKTNPIHDLLY